MTNLENLTFSTFETKFLDDILKNPKKDYQKLISIIDKKVEEKSRDFKKRSEIKQKLKESEEKYRELFNNMNSGVAIYEAINNGEDFIFKDFNQGAEKIENIRKEDLINKKVTEIFPGVKEFGLFQVFQRVLETGKPENHPISQYKDKRIIGWRMNYVYRLSSGEIVAVYDDITKQKQAEDELKHSEFKFRTIAEQSLVGFIILQKGKIIYANEAISKLFEYKKEEILERKSFDFFNSIHPDDRELIIKRFQDMDKKINVSPSHISRIYTKSGKLKWIHTISRIEKYQDRDTLFITIVDITKTKEAENKLIKLNNLKSELLRRTSHELKTPLVSIKGFSNLLLELHKDKFDEYILSTIEEIKKGCIRLENLISDILKTSELESGAIQMQKSEEDLSFLIRLCVNDLKGFSDLRNHRIELEIHDKMVAYFEKEQIHQVISNLLSNSIKYTPKNGKIEIKTEIQNKRIIISIKDNGIGVTVNEKSQLFKQFGKIERFGQGFDIIPDGSGLGLYISKKIIELHDGEIWVESEGRNKGSTFYFSLPLT